MREGEIDRTKKYFGRERTRTAQKVVCGERERTAQERFDGRGIDREQQQKAAKTKQKTETTNKKQSK